MLILILCFGLSYMSGSLSLSPALGAFLAGLLLAESPYAKAVLTEILPFRDLFLSLFFIGVGTLFDLQGLRGALIPILGFTLLFLLLKGVVTFFIALIARYALRTAVYTALGLLHAGEFSFVLLEQGLRHGLLSSSQFSLFLTAFLISLMVSPFLFLFAKKITRLLELFSFPPRTRLGWEGEEVLKDHVIVVGLGLNGKLVLNLLKHLRIPALGVDLNPRLVQELYKQQIPALYGDATREQVLRFAGIARARLLVIAISDSPATREIVALARRLHPQIPIVVRVRYVREGEALKREGPILVVPEEEKVARPLAWEIMRVLEVPDAEARTLLETLAIDTPLSDPLKE